MTLLAMATKSGLATAQSKRRNALGTGLTAVLALSLVACSDSEPTTADADVAVKNTAKVTPDEVTSAREMARASTRLNDVIREYVNEQLDDDQNTSAQDVSAVGFRTAIEHTHQLLDQVKAIDSSRLTLEERIDQKLLTGLLESDTYSAATYRIWEKDASIYIPAGQIDRLLEPVPGQNPADRADALMLLLKAIPVQLQYGKDNLANPPRRFTEAAIFKTQATVKRLENDAEILAGAGAATTDEFEVVLANAISSLKSFEQHLIFDVLPNSRGSWAIGEEHYDYILRHRWLLELDADDIYARGMQAFEETEALAQETSELIEPGKNWGEVYESLKDDHPPANGIEEAYQAWINKAKQFVILNQIVTLPEGEHVVTIDPAPAMRRSSAFTSFQSADRFGTDLEGRLILASAEDGMTPQQQTQSLRSHHHAWIPIVAVHEAYPGYHVAALKTRENPRLLRKIVSEPIFSEGWGLLTEELMFEQGFLQSDDIRLTQLRNQLWHAARVILDVSLHTRRMTFDEAVDFLVERVHVEPAAAELEVGMYIENPTYVLGGLIGKQEILKIREQWIEKNGEPNPPSQFYDALLKVGSLPPALIRESLLKED